MEVDKNSQANYNSYMSKNDGIETGTETQKKKQALHDGTTAHFFREKETAKSFFREYLPAGIVERLDFDSLRISESQFADQYADKYRSDVLYEALLDDSEALIYLLIENKSNEDRFTGFQLLKYIVKIWELYCKQNKKVELLPPIIPIVVYHGPSEWSLGSNFISIVNAPDYVKSYIPDFSFHIYDISHIPDDQIKGAVLLRTLLIALKYIFKPEINDMLKELFQLISDLIQRDEKKGTEYLYALIRYLTASGKYLEKKALEGAYSEVFNEGGDITPLTQLANLNLKYL